MTTNKKLKIQTPNDALVQNQIGIDRALYAGNTNPWYLGLKALGNLGMQIGSSMGGFGEITDELIPLLENNEFAFGGKVPSVEVEGGEVIETPNKKAKKIKGKSHEQGGMDVALPEGSEVFSKRISIDGKTMADRKLSRDLKLKKLEKRLSSNPVDKINKNTYKREKSILDQEEQMDMNLQIIISGLMNNKDNNKAKYGLSQNIPVGKNSKRIKTGGLINKVAGEGTFLDKFKTNLFDYVKNNKDLKNTSIADLFVLGGGLYSAYAPYANTLRSRAGDLPNKNYYENFGQDSMATLDSSQKYIEQQKSNKLKDLNTGVRAFRSNLRKSSRSANTMRATDLEVEQMANRKRNKIYDDFAGQMVQLLANKAKMQSIKDEVVMRGEEAKGLANIQDRDAFFTSLAKNIATRGQGLQETGKNLNAFREEQYLFNLLKKLGLKITVDREGNIIDKNKETEDKNIETDG